MKKTKKISVIILLVIVIASLIAGCSNESSSNNSSSDKQVTIVWSYWGDPWEVAIDKKIAADFEATHKNIKIEQQYAPWSSYFQKLQTQWSGGTSPDVMFLNNTVSYAKTGVLQEITPLAKKYGYNLDDYYPEQLKEFQYDGKLYGVPRDNDTKVLFYNKKLFDDAKIPYPDKNLTWDQLVDISKKLTKKDGNVTSQYGIAFDPSFWFLTTWMNGGQLFDDDSNPTKVLLDDPKAIDALQKLGDLINKDKSAPPYELIKDSSQISQLFTTNKLGLIVGNHALIPSFTKVADLKWDVTYLPTIGNNPKVNVAGGAGYTISSKTKHPKEAWEFWSYLTGPDAQKLFTESQLIVPANKKVLNSDTFLKQSYNAQVFIDETKAGRAYPTTPKANDFFTATNQYFQAIWTGQKSAKDSVNEALPQLKKIIESK